MQAQGSKMAYSEYLQSRLQKIQKYILANKINNEQKNLLQAQMDKSKQQMAGMEEKVKWINFKVNDMLQLFERLEGRLERVQSRVQRYQCVGDRIGRIEEFCGRNCCNLVFRSDIDTINIQIDNKIAKTQKRQKTDHNDLASQLEYLKQQLNTLQSQTNKLQTLYNNNQKQNNIYKSQEMNVPTQILVTKKELRESIQLLEEIYDHKIGKLERRVRRYWGHSGGPTGQSQGTQKKKAQGTTRSGKKLVNVEQAYFNDYFQEQMTSKHNNSSPCNKLQAQQSTLHLKPLILVQKKSSKSKRRKSKSKNKMDSYKTKNKIKSERSEKRVNSYSNSKYRNQSISKDKDKGKLLGINGSDFLEGPSQQFQSI